MTYSHTAAASADFPTLTAQEFIAQGTSAGAVASIARSYWGTNPVFARRLRHVALEVARINGTRLRYFSAGNDNRKQRGRRAA